jgi:hypothetical protein
MGFGNIGSASVGAANNTGFFRGLSIEQQTILQYWYHGNLDCVYYAI